MDFDAVVVGAGVVGIASAAKLAELGLSVLLVEKGSTFGQHSSSRNSEVIHAGLYYQPGSLKARLCIEGKEMLYERCRGRGIPNSRLGKLVVATDESQVSELEALVANASLNGVVDLQLLDGHQVKNIEPNISAVAAFLSPSSGIVDSHALMLDLFGELQAYGGIYVESTAVQSIRGRGGSYEIELSIKESPNITVRAPRVVNAAGLFATDVARTIEFFPVKAVPALEFVKGTYYITEKRRRVFQRLIYPLPNKDLISLGIHATNDLAGCVRFGPDAEVVREVNYEVDSKGVVAARQAISQYFPRISLLDLRPDYCGIRPRLNSPDGKSRDFSVQNGADFGFPGLINLYGIESPGLTASLSLARHVAVTLDLVA